MTPPKPKTNVIPVRFADDELARVDSSAAAEHLPRATYIHKVVLDAVYPKRRESQTKGKK